MHTHTHIHEYSEERSHVCVCVKPINKGNLCELFRSTYLLVSTKRAFTRWLESKCNMQVKIFYTSLILKLYGLDADKICDSPESGVKRERIRRRRFVAFQLTENELSNRYGTGRRLVARTSRLSSSNSYIIVGHIRIIQDYKLYL